MKKAAVATVFAMMLVMAGAAFAQDSKSEVSASVAANITKDASDSNYQTSTTKSAAIQASYAYYLGKFGGVQADYGYSRFSNKFSSSAFGTIGNVPSNVNQVTLGYIYKMNKGGKISPFVTAGGGWLIFSPTSAGKAVATGVSTQTRDTFTYGVGFDYKISKSFAVRAAYNGYVYKLPTYGSSALGISAYTHTALPSVGIVYHF